MWTKILELLVKAHEYSFFVFFIIYFFIYTFGFSLYVGVHLFFFFLAISDDVIHVRVVASNALACNKYLIWEL